MQEALIQLKVMKLIVLGPRITPVPCYGYVSADDYCPPLIDNDYDGEPDTPYYNQYASYRINRPIGGNVLLETSLNLIFKIPFIEDQSQFRTAFFVDLGMYSQQIVLCLSD